MTPDNYVKTMKRLLAMDEQKLFDTFLAEKAKFAAGREEQSAAGATDDDELSPKVRASLDMIEAIGDVMSGKYGFHIHLG